MKILQLIVISGIFLCMQSCIPEGDDQNLEGDWSCQETSEIFGEEVKSSKGTTIFPVYIVRNATYDNKYYINNFYQLGDEIQVEILVSGGRTITIETQKVNGINFSGSGVVSADYNTINLTYTADDGGGIIDNVSSEMKR